MSASLLFRLKGSLLRFARFFVQLGIDPRRIALIKYYPDYLIQARLFNKLGGTITYSYPILHDYKEQAGSARGHYFHQDLLVASAIFRQRPERHIDIGSRIDGFVAHVASFREIEVIDIRDLEDTGHENIIFIKSNLMEIDESRDCIADSISCLHVIEHFGLGRYGDPVDPQGHVKGFKSIVRMLKANGMLYISFPIGMENEIHFNAHRVFHPKEIFNWIEKGCKLRLMRFDYIDDNGDLHRNVDLNTKQFDVKHGCGVYTFLKE